MAKSTGFDLFEQLRKVRDQGMDAWAKTTLRITSSEPYHRAVGVLVQPGLIATALFRRSSGKAMSQLLAQLHMPSREEVLSLSQRLTHIEVALDDLSAAIDAVRAAYPQGEPAATNPSQGNGTRGRARAAGEG
jgi:hypothetical protein